jgi:uroporphyrinogen decarboxylase
MNLRERFLEVMLNFNTSVPTIKWEFGYWGETINHWYREGLPCKNPTRIPTAYTSPTASLYTKTWTCENQFVRAGEYPQGMPITAGGLYQPSQGFPLDQDVREALGLDQTQRLVDLNLLFYPMFEPQTIEESDTALKYRDLDGVVRIFLKESATIASGWEWPIKDKQSWQQLKDERLRLDDIRGRLPANWEQLVQEYRDRDYPLGLGGYPFGFFGTLVDLIGYENLFYLYYDDSALIHDIMNTFTEIWIAVFAEVLKDVEIDHLQIWEDISFGSGSMVPPRLIREYMLPYYKRVTGFLKSRGVKLIFVDTDGDCMDIIPLFIEGGATGMFPFEVHCGMDIVKVRREYPNLAMMGGIPKSEISSGKERIDSILEPVQAVLKTGGYIPFGDHLIPPDVPWEHFQYYRRSLNSIIDRAVE